MKIRLYGYPRIYKKNGGFSVNAREITPEGEGEYIKAFLKLRADLEKGKYFDQKRPITRFVRKIGLVTSTPETGDAYNDFKKNLLNIGLDVQFVPVNVEGVNANHSIINAIKYLNSLADQPDVIVLIRGGGSWESLKAFNSKDVALALYGSKIPTIVGVGHEKDETIADFVADLRVSTPTGAAKVISEHWIEFENKINSELQLLGNKIGSSLRTRNMKLDQISSNLIIHTHNIMANYDGRVIRSYEDIKSKLSKSIDSLKKTLDLWETSISKADPTKIMKKGYSLVTLDGSGISDSGLLKIGDKININFYKGSATSQVKEIKND